jgi:hypothetical protein
MVNAARASCLQERPMHCLGFCACQECEASFGVPRDPQGDSRWDGQKTTRGTRRYSSVDPRDQHRSSAQPNPNCARSFHSALCQSNRHDLVNGSAQRVLHGFGTGGACLVVLNAHGPSKRSDNNRNVGNTATNAANCISDLSGRGCLKVAKVQPVEGVNPRHRCYHAEMRPLPFCRCFAFLRFARQEGSVGDRLRFAGDQAIHLERLR